MHIDIPSLSLSLSLYPCTSCSPCCKRHFLCSSNKRCHLLLQQEVSEFSFQQQEVFFAAAKEFFFAARDFVYSSKKLCLQQQETFFATARDF